jgi:hypothetical protein
VLIRRGSDEVKEVPSLWAWDREQGEGVETGTSGGRGRECQRL